MIPRKFEILKDENFDNITVTNDLLFNRTILDVGILVGDTETISFPDTSTFVKIPITTIVLAKLGSVDTVNDTITVDQSGTFTINVSVAFAKVAITDLVFGIGVNGNQPLPETQALASSFFGGATANVGFSATCECANGTELQLMVRNTTDTLDLDVLNVRWVTRRN
jgi:hypothetical protein